jgi:hypothetical protein
MLSVLLQALTMEHILASKLSVAIDPQKILQEAQSLKIYVYDLASAGLQPPLHALAPGSPACTNPSCQGIYSYGTNIDLCNYGYGTPERKRFASPWQGSLWSNSDGGFSIAMNVHARLLHSPRRTLNPDEADLFFIPLYSRQLCLPWHYAPYLKCGFSIDRQLNITRLWEWIDEQQAWQNSDGSNHFVIAAQHFRMFSKGRVCYLHPLKNCSDARRE